MILRGNLIEQPGKTGGVIDKEIIVREKDGPQW